jgi:beta-phosphoglucomutase-like phosphatase (HAD superfamily)
MLKELEVEPSEAIVVEDSIHGIMSAWAAGTWTVALTGSIPEVDMPERHATIHHLEQLTPDLFDRITGTAPVGL